MGKLKRQLNEMKEIQLLEGQAKSEIVATLQTELAARDEVCSQSILMYGKHSSSCPMIM